MLFFASGQYFSSEACFPFAADVASQFI